MPPPVPTPIYRITHIDNLDTILGRNGLHAPNHAPADQRPYRAIHDANVQAARRIHQVHCGPCGTIHDYVPFYFGPLSVMLLKLKTGQVAGYNDGQAPLIYLVASAQALANANCRYVFTDGHGLATFTSWYDDLASLDRVDWNLVGELYWADTLQDNDRQRRKQAEFLVWQSCQWPLITEIAVLSPAVRVQVLATLNRHPMRNVPQVTVRPDWYYY
jgi:hypothetical protein